MERCCEKYFSIAAALPVRCTSDGSPIFWKKVSPANQNTTKIKAASKPPPTSAIANDDLITRSTSPPSARPWPAETRLIVAAPVPPFRIVPKPTVAVSNIQCPYFWGPSVFRKYGVTINTRSGYQAYSSIAQIGLTSLVSIRGYSFCDACYRYREKTVQFSAVQDNALAHVTASTVADRFEL